MKKQLTVLTKILTALVVFIFISSQGINAATCTVTTGTTHQTIRGFGGSNAWSDWSGSDCAQNSWFTAANLDMLFTTNGNGIGLSIIRMRIPPDSGSFGAAAAPVQGAAARGALVMATEWTPPAAWKSNGAVDNQSGAYLLTSHYQDYANYLRDYVNTMKNTYGVTVYALCNSNEPDYMVGYDGCTWSGAQEQDFIKNYLGPTFATAGLTTKIIVGESYANNFAITDPTLNDATAANYVSIAGVHTYGGGPTAYPLAVSKGKEYWMTEMADFNAYDASMAGMGLKVADWLYTGLVNAEYNAWIYWWLSANTAKNEGLTTTSGNPKRFFVMGNYSKFVRPGYVRIDTTAPGGNIFCSAFRDTSSTNFVFIAENKNTSAQSITFNTAGIGITSVTPWITDSSRDLASQAAVAVSGNSFTYSLPAQSVVSFVGGAPAGTPTNTPNPAWSKTFTPTSTATPNSILLDDMEDGNNVNNWGGNWYSYSGTGTTITPKPFVMTAGGMTGSPNYRAQIIATVADYGGLGTDLNSGSTAVDLTNYTAVEFWVKGNGGTYWFQFTQPSITDGDNFGVSFTAPAAWTKVTVPINAGSLAQRGFGAASTFTKNAIAALQWQSNANGALDIEIDNVVLLSSISMSPTFTLTKTPGTTFTYTRTPTPTSTRTATPTYTLVNTSTFTRTNTAVNTATNTPVNTATFTRTNSPSASASSSSTPVNTSTYTRTSTPVNTATNTSVNTATFTRSATATSSATASVSPSNTNTRTPTNTPVNTATYTVTRTSTPGNTATSTSLNTATNTPVNTATYTITRTNTPGNTATNTSLNTATNTPVNTATYTRTRTNTPVNTATNTPVSTATYTRTPSATTSVSPTITNTRTPTGTPVSTFTNTPVNTLTNTAVNTASASATASVSPTRTFTITETRTASVTPTFTYTRTPTYTATRTGTPSRTLTFTRTSTPTRTESPDYSPTETWTGTPPTSTVTPSITQTETELPTDTDTATDTKTPTSSVTATITLSATASVSPSNTYTRTPTITSNSTFTSTVSPSRTATATPSRTVTVTPTNTSINTATFTRTVSVTATSTNSVQPTSTSSVFPSNTFTKTPTFQVTSSTATRTASPSVTATLTLTLTYNLTFTPTITPTIPWDNTFTIDDAKAYPNPYKPGSGDLSVHVTISKPAGELKARIYTVNFRRVFETPAVSANTRDVIITVPGWKLTRLAAGTYYMIVAGVSTDKELAISKPTVLIILK